MRFIAAFLAVLALALNGAGVAAAAPKSAPETHADIAMGHDAESEPCDCCDHGMPAGSDCQMKASCVCAPGLAVAPAIVASPVVLAVPHARPSGPRIESREPEPLRRPPRLAS